MTNTEQNKSYLFFLISTFSLILSIYTSGKYFTLDADTINSALVWGEIERSGFHAIKEWIPTDDNWYLSVYPIHFIIYKIFGYESINTLIAISSLQVFTCAIISFLILSKITSNKNSIFIVPFLCFLPYFCYKVGFISHPFSHNTSNLYGLLLIYVNLRINRKILASIISSLIILIAGVSDPWYIASFGIPFLLYQLLSDSTDKKNKFIPSTIALISLLIYFSHILQNWLAVPLSHFHLASIEVIKSNIYWYAYGIGSMLNLFYADNEISRIASFVVIMTLGAYGLYKLYFAEKNAISFLLVMSVAGISGAYILGSPEKQYYSARFLVNIVYIFYIISFFMILSKHGSKHLYIIAISFISISSLVVHLKQNSDNLVSSAESQVKFMEQNGLNYGFGPYWSGNPNVVNWLSKGEIDFSPVIFRNDNGFIDWNTPHAQSFRNKIKPGNKKTFIMLSSDGESCSNIDLCIDGINKQYGKPDAIIKYQSSLFYVYDKGLN